ncbi:MAG: hypothetical protein WB788_09290 [Thermoplasmata archaeon]|nr:hypothetical protein [Thermoplasmata archaeon]
MERRFARLSAATPLPPGSSAVPDAGMCLSVFLVLRSPEDPHRVLMGRANPSAPWWEFGGLDPGRLERVGRSWMLPSRQLLLFEGPEEAARVIAREQLGAELPTVSAPAVFSDPSRRPGSEHRDPHWDFHFVFDGRWPTSTPPSHRLWQELSFVDVPKTRRSEIARGQGDVLELIGLSPMD